MITFMYYQNK